jgi:hypothetical protein
MNKYDELKNWISCGMSAFMVATLAIVYYMTGGLSSEHLTEIMSDIGATYDTSAKTLTYNSKSYTIAELFAYVIANDYKTSTAVSYSMIFAHLMSTRVFGYITSEEYATLLEALNNA